MDHYLNSASAYQWCLQQKKLPEMKTEQISIQGKLRKTKNFGPLLAY